MNTCRRDLRVALLGQGSMGKAHSNAYAQVSRFFDPPFRLHLQVLCGRNQDLLEQAARKWGWAETSTDWLATVQRADIDLVDIALPNHLHAEVAKAAAQAGKIVLSEKPLANSVTEAEEMVEAARNVPTMVWFNYRRVPAIAYAKRMIQEGKLGRTFHYRGFYQQQWGADPKRPPNWKMDPSQAGHGVVGDLLSHVVDLALFLNGSIEQVSALTQVFAPQRQVEDAVSALVRFANGSIGMLEATRFGIGHRNANTFEVQGEGGMLSFNLENMNELDYFNAQDPPALQGSRRLLVTDPQHPYASHFWRPGHIIGYEHTFIAALADFLTAVAANEPFHPNFEDGLCVERVLDAILKSAESAMWKSVSV